MLLDQSAPLCNGAPSIGLRAPGGVLAVSVQFADSASGVNESAKGSRGLDGGALPVGTLVDVGPGYEPGQCDRLVAALTAGLARRLTEPLSTVIANLGCASEALEPTGTAAQRGEVPGALADARRGAEELHRLLRDLALLARRPTRPEQSGDACLAMQAALAIGTGQLPGTVLIDRALSGPLRVTTGEPALARALLRLVVDAVEAMTDRRQHHRLRVATERRGTVARIEVEDSGHHAEPGDGVHVCAGLARSLGGTIAILPAPAGGRLVRLELPLA